MQRFAQGKLRLFRHTLSALLKFPVSTLSVPDIISAIEIFAEKDKGKGQDKIGRKKLHTQGHHISTPQSGS